MGAILAGGASSRFGSDKALALHAGKPLIQHVADALALQCNALVICGREWGSLQMLTDQPATGLGPMGGLAAALSHAQAAGHDGVLCSPCDLIGLPADALARLSPGPAVVDGQWLTGYWPAPLAPALLGLLVREGAISARRLVDATGARTVSFPPMRNINRPSDLR